MMQQVYIVILNYKNWADVVECLETVFRSQYDHFKVIVIDNDSQNNSLGWLKDWAERETTFENRLSAFSKDKISKPVGYKYFDSISFDSQDAARLPVLTFIQNDSNRGFAAGINPVLKKIIEQDAYVWLLNPDMVVEESTLSELSAFAAKNHQRSVIGSVIKYHERPLEIHLYGGGIIHFNSGTIRMIQRKADLPRMDYVSGTSLFTHTQSFKELGLLPEDYFLYWEETDWCYQAKLKGYQLLLCENAVCYDKISASVGKSFLADYYYTKNGLLFLLKYKKEKINTAIFFIIFRLLKRLLLGQVARANGVYKGLLSFLNRKKDENK